MTQSIDSFEEIESAVVRFAGDSGDGMQTVGERFTDSSAFAGNDIATLPDFPAEIRAPAGTLMKQPRIENSSYPPTHSKS